MHCITHKVKKIHAPISTSNVNPPPFPTRETTSTILHIGSIFITVNDVKIQNTKASTSSVDCLLSKQGEHFTQNTAQFLQQAWCFSSSNQNLSSNYPCNIAEDRLFCPDVLNEILSFHYCCVFFKGVHVSVCVREMHFYSAQNLVLSYKSSLPESLISFCFPLYCAVISREKNFPLPL